MSPDEIEVLLHVHRKCTRHPRYEAPAVIDAFKMFIKSGIFEQSEYEHDTLVTTDRGKALVNVLCRTPFPLLKWVDKDNNIVS